ncbi:MAG TPA: HAD-IIA family hydrolase [Candidatus Limnocylindria bacterium]|nr:HAD-IIA family hydrolase [Candidatus Limnocylindria bacterium]
MHRSGEPTLRLVIFDLDGVIYRGRQPVPGAAELVAGLRDAGLLVRFATNNSMASRAMYVPRLVEMGIPAEADEIVTSTSATIDHLGAHLPEVRNVMAVGASGMLDELRAAGFDATAAGDAVDHTYDGGPLARSYDAVIAGLDPAFDFRRLAAATTAIRAGARFIATNADLRYPTPTGFLPGAGSIIAALRAAGGVEPLVIGKPEPGIFTAILERAGVGADEAIAIGDNPDADMVAAHRAGMQSILVLTGVADAALVATLEGERRPDQVARDPTEVAALLRRRLS